jgi:hypothetical protein
MIRIFWFAVSAMYSLLDASIAIPLGLLNLAAVPVPSLFPLELEPAKVDTTLLEMIRILLEAVSVT